MPRITPTVQKKIKKSYSAILTASEIRRRFRLPANARLVFRVPGGGDWSNTDVELDDHNGIGASWETER